MASPAMAILARSLGRARALGQDAVFETAAHGTVKALVSYGRQMIEEDRYGAKVPILAAAPTLIVEEAAAPKLAAGDAVHVDGKLFVVRAPLPNGKGRIRATLEEAQASRAEWEDHLGAARAATVYVAGATGPDGQVAIEPGDEFAVLSQDPAMSAVEDGAVVELDDDGGLQAEVLAVAAWTPGWTRLALRRVT